MSEKVKIWRSKISPTCRGAIFRAKRWFYATFYAKTSTGDKEKSKENWARLARAMVEISNKEGVSDKAARITIYYTDEGGTFNPIRAEIEVYEIKPVKTLEVKPE